jgi:hypothetical protein
MAKIKMIFIFLYVGGKPTEKAIGTDKAVFLCFFIILFLHPHSSLPSLPLSYIPQTEK